MSSKEDQSSHFAPLPPFTSSLAVYFDDHSINVTESNTSEDFALPGLSPMPAELSINDIDPEKYGLSEEYDKQAILEYLKHESKKVFCSECNKQKYLLDSFYDEATGDYLCLKCSAKRDDIKNLSWEDEERCYVKGYRRCKRLAHYKPLWSFISRNKQTSKDKKNTPLNECALKDQSQCIYCRNVKKWEYLKKKEKLKKNKKHIDEDDEDEDDYI